MSAVAFMTLGCKVNQFETETMEGLFRARGYDVVPFEESADVYVVNTCSVTHLSDRKSRQIIRRAARTNPRACIAVCGCYAQVAPEEIRALEGVRVVIGTKERAQIVDYVEEAMRAESGISGQITDIMQARTFEDIPLAHMPQRTRASRSRTAVKISARSASSPMRAVLSNRVSSPPCGVKRSGSQRQDSMRSSSRAFTSARTASTSPGARRLPMPAVPHSLCRS